MLDTKVGETVRKIGEISEFIKSNKVTRIECSISQDEINKLSMLQSVLARIDKLNNTLKQAIDEKDKLQEEYKPILKEYQSIEVCPYCGNKLHGKEAA